VFGSGNGEKPCGTHIDFSERIPLETDTRTGATIQSFSQMPKNPKRRIGPAVDIRSKSIPTSTDWWWD